MWERWVKKLPTDGLQTIEQAIRYIFPAMQFLKGRCYLPKYVIIHFCMRIFHLWNDPISTTECKRV